MFWREGTLKELGPQSFVEWMGIALILIFAILLILLNLLFFWPF